MIGLIQTIALLGGFVASLFVAQRIALRLYKRESTAGLLPWALLFLLAGGGHFVQSASAAR
ncbi:MAG: hypothetical protein U0521_00330 [Anaerolineae bacterium]